MPTSKDIDLYLGSVVIDVNDLDLMTTFWRDVLGYEVELKREHWAKLTDPKERGATVSLQTVPETKSEKNRLHLDLYANDPRAELERVRALGAELVQGPQKDKDFVVLADPEKNLFCIIDKSRD